MQMKSLMVAAVALTVASPITVHAVELTAFVSNALKSTVEEHSVTLDKGSGVILKATYGTTEPLRLRIEKGEMVDFALLGEEAIDCDYREPGHLHLALGDAQLAALAGDVAALCADGFVADLLERRQLQALIATPLGPTISGGVFAPEDGLLHSAQLVYGLAAAAERHGALLATGTALIGLTPDGGGLLARTTRGDLRADAAVVAANAWIDQIIPALAGCVTPVRGQALAFAPAPAIFAHGMGAALTPTGEYWQQAPDGTIVLGGCRAVAPGQDVGIRDSRPTPEVQTALEQALPQLFPALVGLRVARRWAGPMAFTADYLPIADPARHRVLKVPIRCRKSKTAPWR
jgi:glycine/D-amino acid oxidase-like deaminating enzyme